MDSRKNSFTTQVIGQIMEGCIAAFLLVELQFKFLGQFLLFCTKPYQKSLDMHVEEC